jgi:hypothetical protein
MADDQAARDAQNTAAAQAIFQLFQNWLTRVESKIDNLTGRLEGKADRSEVADVSARLDSKVEKADFERLSAKVDRESDRLDGIDKKVGLGDQRDTDRTEWHRWAVPVALTLIYTIATVVVTIYTLHH